VRQLCAALPKTAPPGPIRQDVAERLGQWLDLNEAIQLHAAQSAISAAGASAHRRALRVQPSHLHASLRIELDRLRSTLTRSITTRSTYQHDPGDLDTEFALFHQRLGDLQRLMEISVDALREHVRQQLAQSTPEMAQLAATDAVMDGLFGLREERLLATVPTFLKARFVAMRQQAAAAEPSDDMQWLNRFAAEFEQILLAELDLRLQPVMGLIESLEP
jgi:hypothetical protein